MDHSDDGDIGRWTTPANDDNDRPTDRLATPITPTTKDGRYWRTTTHDEDRLRPTVHEDNGDDYDDNDGGDDNDNDDNDNDDNDDDDNDNENVGC